MTISDIELGKTAHRMLADYDAANPGTIYDEGFRLSLPDAWRLQIAVTKLRIARGERVIGYKMGAQTPVNQTLLGLPHPVWGSLWDTELHNAGATLQKTAYANIAIEAEFGVILAHDIRPDQSDNAIIAAIETVHPLLELHNLVLRSDKPHGHELIANNCINCGVVLGGGVAVLNKTQTTDLRLIYDGGVIDEWSGLMFLGEIAPRLRWLAGALAEYGLGLKAGDLVLTGAWGPPIPVGEHERVDVTSSAFGDVHATFV